MCGRYAGYSSHPETFQICKAVILVTGGKYQPAGKSETPTPPSSQGKVKDQAFVLYYFLDPSLR